MSIIFNAQFNSPSIEPLKWFNPPAGYVSSDGKLSVITRGGSDFWQKTYYSPTLVKHSGHFLHFTPQESKFVMEVEFQIRSRGQFDHAGLMVMVDEQCWIKTGLENVDGTFQLSAVITNEFSDWSTQAWPTDTARIRIYRFGSDFVIETEFEPGVWKFFRIAHLNIPETLPVKVGLFCASPKVEGGGIDFKGFSIRTCEGYDHHA